MLDNISRAMIEVSNNSRLTKQVAISLEDKLSPEEIRDFMEWLNIVHINMLEAEILMDDYLKFGN